ncbi:Quino protein amine dehydrogenase [Epithele typhae]|uniref:Quino protein amine dehydrogenase n=1 Tax=Epithele typhae TaxID=378194 RepID=UPI00200726CF|nr:Quino protein amine dehydrogenase [Epithele typhae]KAH9938747.1 Quino protein amine dehydrogenase [Epithele typhae]
MISAWQDGAKPLKNSPESYLIITVSAPPVSWKDLFVRWFHTLHDQSLLHVLPLETLPSITDDDNGPGGSATELTIWDTDPGIPVLTEWYEENHPGSYYEPHCVAFSPDEAQFAFASPTAIHMYALPLATSSTTSSNAPHKIGRLSLDAQDTHFVGVLWSLNGTQIFVQDALARVHVCDASSFAHLRSLLVPSSELAEIQCESLFDRSHGLSAVGHHILSILRFRLEGEAKTYYIFVWDSSTGTCRYKSTDSQSPSLGSKLWSEMVQVEDQLHIISVCGDGTLRKSKITSTVEDTHVVTQLFSESTKIPFSSSPFTADGARRVLVLLNRRSLSVVDTMTGFALFRLNRTEDIDAMEWSADGRTAIFVAEENGIYTCWIWNIEEGTTKAVFRWPHGSGFYGLEISADGSMVGFSSWHGDVVFRRVSDLMASALDL